jgi:D-apionolactonase
MTKTPDLVRIFGTAVAIDPPQRIIAGPLRVELKGGNLGTIAYQWVEVLRGISYLVRDENWGTCPAKISKIARKKSKGRLQLPYTQKSAMEKAGFSGRSTLS